MSIEIIQKVLLAGLPVYFYFVPEFLFPIFYDNYIKSQFYKIDNQNPDAYSHIQDLKTGVTRILRFIAFLTIVVVSIIATFFNKEHHSLFWEDCTLLSYIIGLIGLSGWMIYVNFQREFLINNLEQWLEKIIIFTTIPLFYFWGG